MSTDATIPPAELDADILRSALRRAVEQLPVLDEEEIGCALDRILAAARTSAEQSRELGEAKARIAELEERAIGTHYESNGEAGDGQTVCNLCGEETDEPHTPAHCRECWESHSGAAWHQAGVAEEKLSKSTARLDALRIAVAKLKEGAQDGGEVGAMWVWSVANEALAADDAAAGGVVAESATSGETKVCPECGGEGETSCPKPFAEHIMEGCDRCGMTGRIPVDDAGSK